MSTEREAAPHTPRKANTAQKIENLLGVLMVIAIAILAIGLVYGILQTGSTTPSYVQ